MLAESPTTCKCPELYICSRHLYLIPIQPVIYTIQPIYVYIVYILILYLYSPIPTVPPYPIPIHLFYALVSYLCYTYPLIEYTHLCTPHIQPIFTPYLCTPHIQPIFTPYTPQFAVIMNKQLDLRVEAHNLRTFARYKPPLYYNVH
jgi:hypothetical protein